MKLIPTHPSAAWIVFVSVLLHGVPAATAQSTEAHYPSPAADTLTVTLAEAHARALSSNPEYAAAREAVPIARGDLRQSGVYPFNPELELSAPGAGTDGEIGDYQATLRQEVEWAGQRGLRLRDGRLGVERAASLVGDAARRTLADVSHAFYEAMAFEERLMVAREMSSLMEELVAVTRIQAIEGEISQMDATLAEIEAGRARAAVRSAERERASALVELRRLLGLPPGASIRPAGAIHDEPAATALSVDSLTALALARRPDLVARGVEVERRQTRTRLARREAIPDLRLGLTLEREDVYALTGPAGSPGLRRGLETPRLGLSVSMAMPIFDRNQGTVAAEAARADQAVAERAAAELAVRAEVADAFQAHLAASEEHRILEEEVLQPARANQRLLETAFRAGKVALPTLLLLRNQLLEAELSHWDAWLAERRALVDLAAATATFTEDLVPAAEVGR